jgi:Concanavalin A-like lectin/glucanases superfamily
MRAVFVAGIIVAVAAATAAPAAAQYSPDENTELLEAFDGTAVGEEHGTISFEPSLPALNEAVDLGPGDWIKYAVPAWAGDEGTVEAWIHPRAYEHSIATLQWRNADAPPADGYVGHFDINAAGHLAWSNWGGSCPEPPIGGSVIPLDEWTHVAVTWSPSGTALYVNGVLDATTASNCSPALSTTIYVYLNGWGQSDHGLVDDLRISSVARSQADLRAYVVETLPAPYFSVSPINPPESMWGEQWAANAEVTIEIDDPGTGVGVDFSTTASTDGKGRFELSDIPFDIAAGQLVTVSQGATVKTHVVIDLRVTLVDPVADTVSGTGAPNTETTITIWDGAAEEGSPPQGVMSDAAGRWTADFSGIFDIRPRMMAFTYQADDDGDRTQVDGSPPSFLVFRGWFGLAGFDWPAGVDVHVTADDPGTSGNPDLELTLATDAHGFFEGAGVFPGLSPGWVITVASGAITVTTTVRAISVTDVDVAIDRVRGIADPGTQVWVSVNDTAGRYVTADASGEWAADFAGTCDITVGSEIGVNQDDGGGGGTNAGFTVPFPPIPIPPGTSLATPEGIATSGTPAIYWQDPITLSTTGPAGGSGWATLTMHNGSVHTVALVETVPGGGVYTGTFDPLYPDHGPATISYTIDYPGGSQSQSFTLYIDPSGFVHDSGGHPVAGATVTLYRSVEADGPFVAVSDGSAIMSPGNRTNPDVTDAGGHFGWDVVPGFYKVRAEKAGCSALNGGPFVETDVLTIPPPVTDLALVLDCGAAPTTLTYTGDTQVLAPKAPTLRASLATSGTACSVLGKTVSFFVDTSGDGDFDDAGEAIGAAQTVAGTNDAAQATLSPDPPLPPGVYLVKVAFAGSSGCAASEDANGVVSVVTAGDAANGGGWYQVAGATGASRAVHFGFTTRWAKKSGSFTGQILIVNQHAWRLKGEVTTLATSASIGTASGTGTLYQWQLVAPGKYDFVLVDGSVAFKVTFKDEGPAKKNKTTKPDSFTVNWIAGYGGGPVIPLVTGSTFQPLKGGNIVIR